MKLPQTHREFSLGRRMKHKMKRQPFFVTTCVHVLLSLREVCEVSNAEMAVCVLHRFEPPSHDEGDTSPILTACTGIRHICILTVPSPISSAAFN